MAWDNNYVELTLSAFGYFNPELGDIDVDAVVRVLEPDASRWVPGARLDELDINKILSALDEME